jgi:type I restriction enzyme S subunit
VSAVLEAREPSARYLEAAQPALVRQFDLLGKAPGGISRLRELILTLAVQGKLAPQLPGDEPAALLLHRIESAKEQLVAAGAMKRPKPQPEIAEDEQPFPTPTGWQWVRLGTLLQKIGAGSTPLGGKEVYVPSGVKFLRSQNVWNDGLRLEGVAYISPATHAKMAGTVVVANDLLFNITGASIGRCAAVPADFDEANVSQHVTIIRPVLPSLNSFLHTALISRLVQQAVMDVQVGVSREGLSIAKLGNFLIPIPPLQEQARIVARVDELMRLCDALEAKGRLEAEQHARLLGTLLGTLTDSSTPEELAANWQRVADHFDLLLDRPEAVDALEQTILQLALRGLLVAQVSSDSMAKSQDDDSEAQIPRRWTRSRVGDVVSMLNGYAFKSEWFLASGTRLVRNVNVGHGSLDWQQSAFVSPVIASEFAQFALAEGDVVLTLDRPIISTGLKLAVVQGCDLPCLLLQRVARLSPDANRLSSAFMLLWLRSDNFVKAIDPGRSNGVPHISTKQVASLTINLPPLAEQARIVTRVTELRSICAQLRQRLKASQTTKSHLAEALVDEVA